MLLFPPGGFATFTDVTTGLPEASTAGVAEIGFPWVWFFFWPAASTSSSFFSSSGIAVATAPFFYAGFGST